MPLINSSALSSAFPRIDISAAAAAVLFAGRTFHVDQLGQFAAPAEVLAVITPIGKLPNYSFCASSFPPC